MDIALEGSSFRIVGVPVLAGIEIAVAAGITLAWIALYLIYGRGRREGRVSILPFGVIVRIGVTGEPLEEGRLRGVLRLYGYLAIAVMMAALALFYYLALQAAKAKFLAAPGEGGEAAGGFIPLIPGVTIPWEDLVYVAVALGVGVVAHELGHAVVAVAEGIRVKNAGIAILLFIPAAFVELDEEQLMKARLVSRLKVFSAGVTANILIALLTLLIAMTAPVAEPSGVKILGVEEGSPADAAGLGPGMVIVEVNGEPVKSLEDLRRIFEKIGVTDPASNVEFTVRVKKESGELLDLKVVKEAGRSTIGVRVAEFYDSPLATIMNALFLLNLGVALVNAAPLLLPLPGAAIMSDGGHVAVHVGERLLGPSGRLLGAGLGVATLILVLGLVTIEPIDLTP
ncbi:probable peptidase [Aeropyrum pernix]|uniref:Probable peptidase n=1 Tax=Aeropyrum pernix TaxID=56636 RepID=A0A401HBX0_AERPX|nr:probable peptidase [Aeropyrum pernix]